MHFSYSTEQNQRICYARYFLLKVFYRQNNHGTMPHPHFGYLLQIKYEPKPQSHQIIVTNQTNQTNHRINSCIIKETALPIIDEIS